MLKVNYTYHLRPLFQHLQIYSVVQIDATGNEISVTAKDRNSPMEKISENAIRILVMYSDNFSVF